MLATAIMLAEGDSGWTITSLLSNVTVLFTTAADLIMAHPVPSAFVGLSLAAAGIGFFKRVIHVR